jgi:hypothetical protein
LNALGPDLLMTFPDAVIYCYSNCLSSIALFRFDAGGFAMVAPVQPSILDTRTQLPNIYPEMDIT